MNFVKRNIAPTSPNGLGTNMMQLTLCIKHSLSIGSKAQKCKSEMSVQKLHYTALNYQLKRWMAWLNIMKHSPDWGRHKTEHVPKVKGLPVWFKLYFICIIYDKYTNNTVYDYKTTTIQMGFRRKSNDLFESVSQEFTLLIYVLSCRNCHLCRE